MTWLMEILKIGVEEQLLINYYVIKYLILLKIGVMVHINTDLLKYGWVKYTWVILFKDKCNCLSHKVHWTNLLQTEFIFSTHQEIATK